MLDQAYARLLLIVAALAGAHSFHEPSSAAAQDARAPVTTVVPAADAQTTAIIDAANAFLATLSGEQKTAVLFDFANVEQRVRWSNLPEGIFKRTGMAWGNLDKAQRTALTDLLGAVLGLEGAENVQEQMAEDDALPMRDGAPTKFGSDHYFVSFLGQPSANSPWTL